MGACPWGLPTCLADMMCWKLAHLLRHPAYPAGLHSSSLPGFPFILLSRLPCVALPELLWLPHAGTLRQSSAYSAYMPSQPSGPAADHHASALHLWVAVSMKHLKTVPQLMPARTLDIARLLPLQLLTRLNCCCRSRLCPAPMGPLPPAHRPGVGHSAAVCDRPSAATGGGAVLGSQQQLCPATGEAGAIMHTTGQSSPACRMLLTSRPTPH